MASLDRNDTVTIPMLVAGRGLLTHSMLTNSLGVTDGLTASADFAIASHTLELQLRKGV